MSAILQTGDGSSLGKRHSQDCPVACGRKVVLFAASVLCLLVTLPVPIAGAKSWTGGTGSWETPAQWSPASAPTNTDDIVIGSAI